MKYLFFLLFGATVFACNITDKKAAPEDNKREQSGAPAEKDSVNLTTIQWLDSTRQNLGTIKEGEIVEITWKFKNTGAHPLVIEKVQPGCGCTLASQPEEPIAPGAEGVIKAKFDSNDRPGHADKAMTVSANIKNHNNGNDTQLSFTADVK